MSYTIRRATRDDAHSVAAHLSDASAIAGTLQLPYPSVEYFRDRLTQTEGVVHLVACSDEEVVGHIGMQANSKIPRRAHAGALWMAVPSEWQRKGVGTALLSAVVDLADNWYGLARLELSVFVDNEPAIGLYKKFDFQIEGTMRKYALRNGTLVDTYAMARLRDRPH